MESVYLNDPNGLKPPKLSSVNVENAKELEKGCADFLCKHLIQTDAGKVFFAQNMSTHLAHITSLIKKVSLEIAHVYISDHEIKWMKELLETPDLQPDATYSNYHRNEYIAHPSFTVKTIKFNEFPDAVRETEVPSIFFISHVSRLTGEIVDIASLYKLIKDTNPNSLLIVDGAQSLGALEPIDVNTSCDVYSGLSSKFIGAEPHLGMFFSSDSFYNKYIGSRQNYPEFDTEAHSKDLFSLWENLQNPGYLENYHSHITSIKNYALESLKDSSIIYTPPHQAANFLTLNFGSKEANQIFVSKAEESGIIVSDNTQWSITEPDMPLVRVGISVRTTKDDIDKLVKVIEKEAPRM